jgi:hypothetical protein
MLARRQLERAFHRFQHFEAQLSVDESLADAARAREIAEARWRMRRDFQHLLVAQHSVARQIALLRRQFAPSRKLAQHREHAAIAAAQLEAPPGVTRVQCVSPGVRQHCHLFSKPSAASVAGEGLMEALIHLA